MGIEEELTTTFLNSTEEVQNEYVQIWTIKIADWLNRARLYINKSENLLEKLKQDNATGLESIKDFEKMMKNRRAAKDLIEGSTVLTDGYVLLNEIGETIRNEEIIYNVTTSISGTAISKAASGEVYTWKIPLSEFLKILSFTSRRITLKSPSAIHKMLMKELSKNNTSNISYEKWSDQKLSSFALFNEQVRSMPQGKYNKINEGNILESFLRYLDSGGEVFSPAKGNKSYWSGIGHAIKMTMAAPDKFFQAGDLNNEQIKGLNASVTNLNTLLINLKNVFDILTSSKVGAETIRSRVRKNFTNQFNSNIELTQQELVQKLLEMFTSSVNRDISLVI